MKSGKLTKDNPTSEEFSFSGECYIMAKGSGTLTIERDVGTGFEVMTNNDGVPMVYITTGGGIIFNGTIKANKKMKYRLLGSNGDITYAVSAEER